MYRRHCLPAEIPWPPLVEEYSRRLIPSGSPNDPRKRLICRMASIPARQQRPSYNETRASRRFQGIEGMMGKTVEVPFERGPRRVLYTIFVALLRHAGRVKQGPLHESESKIPAHANGFQTPLRLLAWYGRILLSRLFMRTKLAQSSKVHSTG